MASLSWPDQIGEMVQPLVEVKRGPSLGTVLLVASVTISVAIIIVYFCGLPAAVDRFVVGLVRLVG